MNTYLKSSNIKEQLIKESKNLAILLEDQASIYKKFIELDLVDSANYDPDDFELDDQLKKKLAENEKKIKDAKTRIRRLRKSLLTIENVRVMKTIDVKIYQLDISKCDYAFMDLSYATKLGFNYNHYKFVYEFHKRIDANASTPNVLDDIFREFNISKPLDYKGRSLSVSDLIVVGSQIYYVEPSGFIHMMKTFKQSKLEAPHD